MSNSIESFKEAIQAHGLQPPEVIRPGKMQRFPGQGKKPGNKAGWCLLFDDLLGGEFGDFSTPIKEHWQADNEGTYTAEERAAFKQQIEAEHLKWQAEEKRKHEAAANQSADILAAALSDPTQHPYAITKTVDFGPLVKRGAWPQRGWTDALLIPIYGADGKIWTLEAINTDGEKDFLKGGRKGGGFHPLGKISGANRVLIGEGLATVAAVHAVDGSPAVAAMDAGNLTAVARAVRALATDSEIILLADNDIKLEGSNPGLKAATEAAQAVGGRVAVPELDGQKCDFWDVWWQRGADAVRDALNVSNEKTSTPSALSTLAQPSAYTASAYDTETNYPGAEAGDQPDTDKEPESKLAERVAESLRDYLAFDEVAGEWYQANNGLWKPITERRAMKTILSVLNLHIPQGYGISKLNNIKSFLMIYLLLDKWEMQRHLIPLANGVLNTETMELEDYTHQHRFNWQLPYAFEPSAKIDVIKRWLWDASDHNIEIVNIIRAFFRIALVGGDLQKFLEIIGPGGTGKSTLLRLFVAFIGEKNHSATDLKNLESNRFEAAALYGKRLALISDSSRYGGEVAVIKALTGGDPVRLEKKNQQQSGSFVFDGVVVIASNEAIQSSDYSSGLIRRRLPIMFNRKVTDADKAKWADAGGIEVAMLKELPGLLNWVLEMTKAEVKTAIGGINGAMTQTQRQHLIETNKLAAWLDDNCIIKPDAILYVGKSMKSEKNIDEIKKTITEKLYSNYEVWCSDNGVNALALQRFTANLIDICEQLKIDVQELNRDKHGKRIKGLGIRSDIHFTYPTPITKKILGAEAVLKKTLDSSDGAEGVEENSFVIFDDAEVF